MKQSNINLNPKAIKYREALITLDELQNLSSMSSNFAENVRVIQKHIRDEQRLTSAKAHSDLGSVWMSDGPNPAESTMHFPNNPEGLRGVEQLTACIAMQHTYYRVHSTPNEVPRKNTICVGFIYKGCNITYQKQVPVRMQNMMHAITESLETDEIIQGKAQLSGAMLDIAWRNTRGYSSGLGYGFNIRIVPTKYSREALASGQQEAIAAFHRYIQLQVQQKLRLAIEKLRLHMDPTLYKRPMRIKDADE